MFCYMLQTCTAHHSLILPSTTLPGTTISRALPDLVDLLKDPLISRPHVSHGEISAKLAIFLISYPRGEELYLIDKFGVRK